MRAGIYLGLYVYAPIIGFVSNVFVKVKAEGLTLLVASAASYLWEPGSIPGRAHVRRSFHSIPIMSLSLAILIAYKVQKYRT